MCAVLYSVLTLTGWPVLVIPDARWRSTACQHAGEDQRGPAQAERAGD